MSPPKVILFDIGGVCVLSPMTAIADYETSHSIPPGYINYAITFHTPHGTWQRAERGEIPLDDDFFTSFAQDLSSPTAWASFFHRRSNPPTTTNNNHINDLTTTNNNNNNNNNSDSASTPPSPTPPEIDARRLFYSMMSVSRTPDPNIYPALLKLRRLASTPRAPGGGTFLLAACSNTTLFQPEDHPGYYYYDDDDDDDDHHHHHHHRDGADDTGRRGGLGLVELRRVFDVFVSSAHVGMRKPERRMYEHTLRECERVARERGFLGTGEEEEEEGLRGQDVVFLDDIGSNLKGAAELGIRGIKVSIGRTADAVRELEKVTGLNLTDDVAKL